MRLGVRLGGVRDGIEAAALQVMHGVEHRGVDVVAQLPVVRLLHLLRVEVRLGLRLGVKARARARVRARARARVRARVVQRAHHQEGPVQLNYYYYYYSP